MSGRAAKRRRALLKRKSGANSPRPADLKSPVKSRIILNIHSDETVSVENFPTDQHKAVRYMLTAAWSVNAYFEGLKPEPKKPVEKSRIIKPGDGDLIVPA